MADPEYIEPTPELRAQLEQFREDHDGDPIGNIATRVLFEDDRVRIWELHLEPGEASDLHHHENDYYLVIQQGDLIAGIPPKSSGIDPFVARIPPEGNTVAVSGGGTEWALNVGEQPYHEILVELKS
jgi:hypothetical protein